MQGLSNREAIEKLSGLKRKSDSIMSTRDVSNALVSHKKSRVSYVANDCARSAVPYTISEDRSGSLDDERARLLSGLRKQPRVFPKKTQSPPPHFIPEWKRESLEQADEENEKSLEAALARKRKYVGATASGTVSSAETADSPPVKVDKEALLSKLQEARTIVKDYHNRRRQAQLKESLYQRNTSGRQLSDTPVKGDIEKSRFLESLIGEISDIKDTPSSGVAWNKLSRP